MIIKNLPSHMKFILVLFLFGMGFSPQLTADHHESKPWVVEIGPENKELLPKGKESDG